MTTYSKKASEVDRKWYVIDASKAPMGRVASEVAKKLIGKHKPSYTPNIDDGDHVVVINAANSYVTGNKELSRSYYRHSGHAGGLKEETLKAKMVKDPTFAISHAVKGMLPKNKLQSDRMKRLHVYADDQHKHAGQTPTEMEIK